MCLARVKILNGKGDGHERMSDVIRIEVMLDGLAVTDLMGETHTVAGTLESIDFAESVVVVKRGEG